MIAVRIHTNGGDRILAACDAELLGQTFREGDMRLKVSETFYKGEVISEEAFRERMRNVTIMNLTGERAVTIAQTSGYVSEESVITIGGVKHAQSVVM